MDDKAVRYPAIGDYALISDCNCNALISRDGSVDWCCMPRVNDDSCFGRILDWDKGGHCSVAPSGNYTASRRYLPGTMILETTFKTAEGEVRLTDFFALDESGAQHAYYDLVRLIDGVSGQVTLRIEVCPRLDCGEILPYMQQRASGTFSAIGSNQGLIIQTDAPLQVIEHRDLIGECHIAAGQRMRLAVQFEFPELIADSIANGVAGADQLDQYFESTRRWWSEWTARMRAPYPADPQLIRSSLILKALTFERTGAIIAASTTSLPEWIGGARNWDYRFTWVRDSVFTIRVLLELGYAREADRFHQFIQRSSAGSADQLQIMYAVDGKRRLTELELPWLEGYRQSRPVRLGNAAAKQVQLDIYGELLQMAWEWDQAGHPTDPGYWNFLKDVVNTVTQRWDDLDHGIWEIRESPRHYVHSKVMCWAAVSRGIQLAEANGFAAPTDAWKATRDDIRAAIETRGYDSKRGVFVQSFDSLTLDAALLLLPRVEFVAYDDPRMLRTVNAICEDLDDNGLLLRYRAPDGLLGPEGTFIPCTFWLVACLALQGKPEQARTYYQRALACGNELGLFSEEYDMKADEMLGNFPQGLTHVSQIIAWLALEEAGQIKP